MKKVLNISLVVLLLTATSGFTIFKHYCGTELVSVKINVKPIPCCGKNSIGCCHEESNTFQLREYFNITQSFIADFNFSSFVVDLFMNVSFQLTSNFEISSIYLNKGYIPPPDLSVVLANIQSFRL